MSVGLRDGLVSEGGPDAVCAELQRLCNGQQSCGVCLSSLLASPDTKAATLYEASHFATGSSSTVASFSHPPSSSTGLRRSSRMDSRGRLVSQMRLRRSSRLAVPGEEIITESTDGGKLTEVGLTVLDGCSHVYHDDCISPWLQQSARCPQCREQSTFASVYSSSTGRLLCCKPVSRREFLHEFSVSDDTDDSVSVGSSDSDSGVLSESERILSDSEEGGINPRRRSSTTESSSSSSVSSGNGHSIGHERPIPRNPHTGLYVSTTVGRRRGRSPDIDTNPRRRRRKSADENNTVSLFTTSATEPSVTRRSSQTGAERRSQRRTAAASTNRRGGAEGRGGTNQREMVTSAPASVPFSAIQAIRRRRQRMRGGV